MQLLTSLKRAVGRCLPSLSNGDKRPAKVLNPFGFNARTNPSLEAKQAFGDWLLQETTQHLASSAGNTEGLKTAIFLALGRAYEAGLTPEETGDAVCASVKAANLGDSDFEFALQQYELLDELLWQAIGQAT